jgi:hypothetical protein
MIKTIKRGEVQTLLNMHPKYYRFMKLHGRKSLLTRFCGIYQVTLRDGNIEDADADGIDEDSEDTQTGSISKVLPSGGNVQRKSDNREGVR